MTGLPIVHFLLLASCCGDGQFFRAERCEVATLHTEVEDAGQIGRIHDGHAPARPVDPGNAEADAGGFLDLGHLIQFRRQFRAEAATTATSAAAGADHQVPGEGLVDAFVD